MIKAGDILEEFYRAGDRFVRAEELAVRFKSVPSGVAAEIAALGKMGFTIESHPHLGHRLLAGPERLMADDIRARLRCWMQEKRLRQPRTAAEPVIGGEVLVLEEATSTNDVIERLAGTTPGEGLAVFAEFQRQGRGRRGRAWASPRGKGLWFSVLLRPRLPLSAVTRITVAASVAIAETLRETAGVDARIKWPNDVTVGGRKLAGILTELRGETDEMALAVLGIGVDVNCGPGDFPAGVRDAATSLLIETGQVQDRNALAARTLAALDDWYGAARADFDRVVGEWAGLCTTLGKQIAVQVGNRRVEGFAQALDGDGALLVRKDNGQMERIVGGDVVVEQA